ncbi:GbsR/MarR family transcriptional regulator [Streptomyces oceani]|uniref:MarR family transcriptional regulator n=1 Tax=Streptomyces oceani TaxID=1075402 RepID=A0A1E7KFF6_9ACTN|nr:MarR family transcriptional regulator [Streptomyces oceani]OEV02648.1 MarR family transcriptional regulator [Streptomyces oceani]
MDQDAELRATAEKLALSLAEGGMQRTMARVMTALLYTQQETMTAGDLCERLQISTGAVSGAIKQLVQVGMIERVPAPGSRRDHYQFRGHAWATMMSNQNAILKVLEEAAAEGLRIVGKDTPAGHRLDEMRDFHAFMQREMTSLFTRWCEQYETPATQSEALR